MSNVELINVIGGGASISGTFINSICKFITTILDLGRTIGSALYYAKNGKSCNM